MAKVLLSVLCRHLSEANTIFLGQHKIIPLKQNQASLPCRGKWEADIGPIDSWETALVSVSAVQELPSFSTAPIIRRNSCLPGEEGTPLFVLNAKPILGFFIPIIWKCPKLV